jgi:hypothetical protein
MISRTLAGLLAASTFALSLGWASPPAETLSTERLVNGVITTATPTELTIASSQRTVTGKIDRARTKVTLHGKAAKLSDLKVTDYAKAELCLDEVWVSIDAR